MQRYGTFNSIKDYPKSLELKLCTTLKIFQFHQGLSNREVKQFQIEKNVSFNSIKDYLKQLVIFQHLCKESFNSIKDYHHKIYGRIGDVYIDFQFHQGLSLMQIWSMTLETTCNFQFHQGLSSITKAPNIHETHDFQFHQGLSKV